MKSNLKIRVTKILASLICILMVLNVGALLLDTVVFASETLPGEHISEDSHVLKAIPVDNKKIYETEDGSAFEITYSLSYSGEIDNFIVTVLENENITNYSITTNLTENTFTVEFFVDNDCISNIEHYENIAMGNIRFSISAVKDNEQVEEIQKVIHTLITPYSDFATPIDSCMTLAFYYHYWIHNVANLIDEETYKLIDDELRTGLYLGTYNEIIIGSPSNFLLPEMGVMSSTGRYGDPGMQMSDLATVNPQTVGISYRFEDLGGDTYKISGKVEWTDIGFERGVAKDPFKMIHPAKGIKVEINFYNYEMVVERSEVIYTNDLGDYSLEFYKDRPYYDMYAMQISIYPELEKIEVKNTIGD